MTRLFASGNGAGETRMVAVFILFLVSIQNTNQLSLPTLNLTLSSSSSWKKLAESDNNLEFLNENLGKRRNDTRREGKQEDYDDDEGSSQENVVTINPVEAQFSSLVHAFVPQLFGTANHIGGILDFAVSQASPDTPNVPAFLMKQFMNFVNQPTTTDVPLISPNRPQFLQSQSSTLSQLRPNVQRVEVKLPNSVVPQSSYNNANNYYNYLEEDLLNERKQNLTQYKKGPSLASQVTQLLIAQTPEEEDIHDAYSFQQFLERQKPSKGQQLTKRPYQFTPRTTTTENILSKLPQNGYPYHVYKTAPPIPKAPVVGLRNPAEIQETNNNRPPTMPLWMLYMFFKMMMPYLQEEMKLKYPYNQQTTEKLITTTVKPAPNKNSLSHFTLVSNPAIPPGLLPGSEAPLKIISSSPPNIYSASTTKATTTPTTATSPKSTSIPSTSETTPKSEETSIQTTTIKAAAMTTAPPVISIRMPLSNRTNENGTSTSSSTKEGPANLENPEKVISSIKSIISSASSSAVKTIKNKTTTPEPLLDLYDKSQQLHKKVSKRPGFWMNMWYPNGIPQ